VFISLTIKFKYLKYLISKNKFPDAFFANHFPPF
jgi:hypothetical protein